MKVLLCLRPVTFLLCARRRRRARAAERAALEKRGIPAVLGPANVATGANIVISAVTTKRVVGAGDAIGLYMQPGQIFLYINSPSPRAKRGSSSSVVAASAKYVDAAVMPNVPPNGHRGPIWLAGTAADKAAAFMTPFGMDVEVVGTEIGQASSI